MHSVQEEFFRIMAEMDDSGALATAWRMQQLVDELRGIATSMQVHAPRDAAVELLHAAADSLGTVAETVHARPSLMREIAAQQLRAAIHLADAPTEAAGPPPTEVVWRLLGPLAGDAATLLKNKRDRQSLRRVADIAARELGEGPARKRPRSRGLTLVTTPREEQDA